MEESYYAISFNQGPQRCPGKELAIYLTQSFIYNFIKIKEIGKTQTLIGKDINTEHITQIILYRNNCLNYPMLSLYDFFPSILNRCAFQ